jgi:hypothetical protein
MRKSLGPRATREEAADMLAIMDRERQQQ